MTIISLILITEYFISIVIFHLIAILCTGSRFLFEECVWFLKLFIITVEYTFCSVVQPVWHNKVSNSIGLYCQLTFLLERCSSGVISVLQDSTFLSFFWAFSSLKFWLFFFLGTVVPEVPFFCAKKNEGLIFYPFSSTTLLLLVSTKHRLIDL